MENKQPLILKAEKIAENAQTFSHPWNPKSEMSGTPLGRTVGLKRTGVNLLKVPPGKESFVYHSHQREEEWIYVLSGRGIAEIDEETFEVSAGDFMGFPTPSVAHHLKNAGDEDLLYLVGGENLDIEIADFPRLGKRMLRRESGIEIYNIADARPFGGLEA